MVDLYYTVQFYSEWHCGSGLTAGADIDALVIRDENGFPFIPGKTLKGLLRDAAEQLRDLGHVDGDILNTVFGVRPDEEGASGSEPGKCFFSNAEMSPELRASLAEEGNEWSAYLFRAHSATAVDKNGQAVEHSLRRTETVIPLKLFARIAEVPDQEAKNLLEACMKFVKRLGVNRNRGLGRCDIAPCSEVKS